MNKIIIHCEIYNIDVSFYIDIKYLPKWIYNIEKDETDFFVARTILTEKNKRFGVSIYFKDKTLYDKSILCHECVHAACYILDMCGIKYGKENHETLAYLTGYIFDKITSKLKDNK